MDNGMDNPSVVLEEGMKLNDMTKCV